MLGEDILRTAAKHVGESYVLGARAILSNPHHVGPWDCAELASWCAFQTYGIVFGTYGSDPRKADPYSGKWAEDAIAADTVVSVSEALATPGAFVVRKPGDFNTRIGHVAISVGDGRLYEARSASRGVVLSDDAVERNWSVGVQLPGVFYTPIQRKYEYISPREVLRISHPFMRGRNVVALQCSLEEAGYSVNGIDGVYEGDTEAAVTNFQIVNGLTVDGQVGPETAQALGIGWPIDPNLADCLDETTKVSAHFSEDEVVESDFEDLRGAPIADTSMAPERITADLRIERDNRDYWATLGTKKFFVGTKVPYGSYWGLYQKISDLPKLGGGVYETDVAYQTIGNWAHVLNPTIQGESMGYFGRLNTYDRARFTYGCFQMAAHTAGDNLILLFRSLLSHPESTRYFPDLTLRDGIVHQIRDGDAVSLEREEHNTRYNETQLPDFMNYLNPSLGGVEENEALAAARLILWTTESETARLAQVTLARDTIKKKIGYAKSLGLDIYDQFLPLAIWCIDLRHQGRARISEINSSLAKANPYEALKWAGRSERHRDRVNTVDREIQALISKRPGWERMTLRDVLAA